MIISPDLKGRRRLPLECDVGDWTHAEWLAGPGDLPGLPGTIVAYRPTPHDPWPEEILTFEQFAYVQNGQTFWAYRRIK